MDRGSFLRKVLAPAALVPLAGMEEMKTSEEETFIPTEPPHPDINEYYPLVFADNNVSGMDNLKFKQSGDGSWWIERNGIEKKLI